MPVNAGKIFFCAIEFIRKNRIRLLFKLHKSVHILTDHIKFNIYFISFLQKLHIGMLVGVWNDSNAKRIIGYVKKSKTYTINCYRAFFNYKCCKFCIKIKSIFPASFLSDRLCTSSCCVNMSVAVESTCPCTI